MRFLLLVCASESLGPPPPAFLEVMSASAEKALRSGELISTGRLAPSAAGSRIVLTGGNLSVQDGPFSEAKEVIGSYAMIERPTPAAAIESATWLLEQFRQYWPEWSGEVEVRQVFELSDMPPDILSPEELATKEAARAELARRQREEIAQQQQSE